MYTYLSVCVPHECSGCGGGHRGMSDLLRLELQVVVCLLIWVLI